MEGRKNLRVDSERVNSRRNHFTPPPTNASNPIPQTSRSKAALENLHCSDQGLQMPKQAQTANLRAPLLLQSLEQSRLEEVLADSFAVSQRSFGCTCEQWRGEDMNRRVRSRRGNHSPFRPHVPAATSLRCFSLPGKNQCSRI